MKAYSKKVVVKRLGGADRLLELAVAEGALDPGGDLAGAVEHEQPRLALQVERGHLRPDALVDAVSGRPPCG